MSLRTHPTAPLHVVFSSLDVLSRLCLDESLFRDPMKRNWLVFDQLIPKRDDISLVLGISGKLDELIYETKAREDSCKIIRRFTGGGTVAVDSHAFLVSICCNIQDLTSITHAYPKEIMTWTTDKIYSPTFREYSIELIARENDYVIQNNNKKIGGNAQAISGTRFCHHTSFLFKVNPKTMSYLKLPKKRPEYRENRDHLEFLTGLDDYFVDKENFIEKVTAKLRKELGFSDIIQVTSENLPPLVVQSRNMLL